MRAILILAVYLLPFYFLGKGVKWWMGQYSTRLADVQAEGDPGRPRSRFLLGAWYRQLSTPIGARDTEKGSGFPHESNPWAEGPRNAIAGLTSRSSELRVQDTMLKG